MKIVSTEILNQPDTVLRMLRAPKTLTGEALRSVPTLPGEHNLRVRPLRDGGSVNKLIYFSNLSLSPSFFFAVFVKMNDNNLAEDLGCAGTIDRRIIRGPVLLIISGELIRGEGPGVLFAVTICQEDKLYCKGQLTGHFNNNNYSDYWCHKQFTQGRAITKLYNSQPHK